MVKYETKRVNLKLCNFSTSVYGEEPIRIREKECLLLKEKRRSTEQYKHELSQSIANISNFEHVPNIIEYKFY